MSCESHRRVRTFLQAAAVVSILFALPGCTSVSHPPRADLPAATPVEASLPTDAPSAASNPTSGVVALGANDHVLKAVPDPVSEAEVAAALTALRDATAWGAQFYAPQIYARAREAFDAAAIARGTDPARCRTLLGEAEAAAGSAREAALSAYEADVTARFDASVTRLTEIGADRAFPEEFARLVSRIPATAALFASRSYWDARMEAYAALKGMSELQDRVDSLHAWLEEARVRVEKAIGFARGLDAGTWAPSQMTEAEQKYQAALVLMQVGDLQAAADAMQEAGAVAARLPLLREQARRRPVQPPENPAPPAPLSPPDNAGGTGEPASPARPGLAQSLPSGQRVRIAELSMSPAGAPGGIYPSLSAAVARFDVVAADGLRDAGVMEKVLAGLDQTWEAAVSSSGYFGFIYNDRIQMVKDLGTYRQGTGLPHAPYGAQFRLVGTRFQVNLVVCDVGAAAAARLEEVHRYFENLTGNRGITVLLDRSASGETAWITGSRAPDKDLVPLLANPSSNQRERAELMLGSPALRSLVEDSGIGSSTLRVAYVTLAGKPAVR